MRDLVGQGVVVGAAARVRDNGDGFRRRIRIPGHHVRLGRRRCCEGGRDRGRCGHVGHHGVGGRDGLHRSFATDGLVATLNRIN